MRKWTDGYQYIVHAVFCWQRQRFLAEANGEVNGWVQIVSAVFLDSRKGSRIAIRFLFFNYLCLFWMKISDIRYITKKPVCG